MSFKIVKKTNIEGLTLTVDVTTLFVDDTNNRVGVGTITPTQALEVAGTVYSTSGGFKFPDSSVQTIAYPGSAGFLQTTGSQSMSGSLTNTLTTGNSLVIDTNVLVVDATNNRVGIGTAAPGYALDVTGVINAQSGVRFADGTTQTGQAIPIGQKGALSGVASLDASGKLLATQVPSIAITDTFVVASQAAMLALSAAGTGDVAIRTDLSKSFILQGTTYSVLADWQELLTPISAPAAHAASHVAAGSDPLTLSESQITNLTTDLAAKFPYAGGTMTGALTVGGQIYNTTGGYKFSDTTVQTTAAATVFPSALSFGVASTADTQITEYLLPGFGIVASTDEVGVICPFAGTLSALYVKALTGPGTSGIVITVRKGAVATALTTTLAAAGTSANDTTHSVVVAAGDEITVQCAPIAGITAGAQNLRVSMKILGY
jgi:hypothetical protein